MKTLTAYYDLAIGPVSFDFVTFLIKAEQVRRSTTCDRMHVVIVPDPNGLDGMFRDKSKLYSLDEAWWRLRNIVIPACALVDATHTLATNWTQARKLVGDAVFPSDWDHQTLKQRHHLVGGLFDCRDLAFLNASNYAKAAAKEQHTSINMITLTLRSIYFPDRNTDRKAWLDFADYARGQGFCVVVIQDVRDALMDGLGFAELNLDLRMALYQEADMNFHANGGAASLSWFSEKPYRMFDAGCGDTRSEWNHLFVDQGLPWGETWPWAKPMQKIVYERSTFEVLRREFGQWAGAMKS